jgi:hypothetical protein
MRSTCSAGVCAGPDESLDIEYAQQLTVCVSSIIAAHGRQPFVSMAPVGIQISDATRPKRRKAAALEAAAVAGPVRWLIRKVVHAIAN